MGICLLFIRYFSALADSVWAHPVGVALPSESVLNHYRSQSLRLPAKEAISQPETSGSQPMKHRPLMITWYWLLLLDSSCLHCIRDRYKCMTFPGIAFPNSCCCHRDVIWLGGEVASGSQMGGEVGLWNNLLSQMCSIQRPCFRLWTKAGGADFQKCKTEVIRATCGHRNEHP